MQLGLKAIQALNLGDELPSWFSDPAVSQEEAIRLEVAWMEDGLNLLGLGPLSPQEVSQDQEKLRAAISLDD